jgi:hypothetical protein
LPVFTLPDTTLRIVAPQARYYWNGAPVPLVTFEQAAEIVAAVEGEEPIPLSAWGGAVVAPYDGLMWVIEGNQ